MNTTVTVFPNVDRDYPSKNAEQRIKRCALRAAEARALCRPDDDIEELDLFLYVHLVNAGMLTINEWPMCWLEFDGITDDDGETYHRVYVYRSGHRGPLLDIKCDVC